MAEKYSDLFTNENRNRYYGLRVGDIVEIKKQKFENKKLIDITFSAEVIDFVAGDNNRVVILLDGVEVPWVAEYCKIITKVEDK